MERNQSSDLGRLLAEARHAAGLSQQALASRAGCSIGYVAVLEKGYVPAQSNVLPRLLAALAGDDGEQRRSANENGASAGNADAEKLGTGAAHHADYTYPN